MALGTAAIVGAVCVQTAEAVVTTGTDVEAPKASVEPIVASNGATDLKDGNKAVPGTSSAGQGSDTAGTEAAPEAGANAGPDGGSQQGAAS